MCGIAGIISSNNSLNINRMTDVLKVIQHRGPDGEGIWMSENNKVLLGHRRLSIIDLSVSANQPMISNDNDIIIVFNGEIYNYKELKEQLFSYGFEFKTNSDTEVIIQAYQKWGYDCLNKFNGMFAFAIYDKKSNILFCARDRVGEKPFYYTLQNNEFIFCSEIKGIFAASNIEKKINKINLDCYLNEGFVAGSNTIINNIFKLEPGHSMIFDLKNFEIHKWKFWNLPPYDENEIELNEHILLENLENLLQDAVSKQLIADVPVGVLLSGGVDSSIITAIASKVSNNISTFTVTFPGHRKHDETSHARLISNYFGTKHLELEADATSVNLLPQLAAQYDEPINDSSMIPTFLVSKMIRDHCKVAIGGDGGDELFGGYSHYDKFLKLEEKTSLLPNIIRKYPSRVLYNNIPHGYQGRKWIKAFGSNLITELPLIANYFDNVERNKMYTNNIFQKDFAEEIRISRISQEKDLIQRATRTDFYNYLPEDILVKVDRASMLNSLEIRAPFLDYRIIEFAFGKIPSNLKVTKDQKKVLLKKLCSKILPSNFDIKRKQGFSIPLNEWVKQKEWFDFFADNLLSDEQTIFNHSFIENLLKNFKKRNFKKYSAEPIFELLMFELRRKKYNTTI